MEMIKEGGVKPEDRSIKIISSEKQWKKLGKNTASANCVTLSNRLTCVLTWSPRNREERERMEKTKYVFKK